MKTFSQHVHPNCGFWSAKYFASMYPELKFVNRTRTYKSKPYKLFFDGRVAGLAINRKKILAGGHTVTKYGTVSPCATKLIC